MSNNEQDEGACTSQEVEKQYLDRYQVKATVWNSYRNTDTVYPPWIKRSNTLLTAALGSEESQMAYTPLNPPLTCYISFALTSLKLLPLITKLLSKPYQISPFFSLDLSSCYVHESRWWKFIDIELWDKI